MGAGGMNAEGSMWCRYRQERFDLRLDADMKLLLLRGQYEVYKNAIGLRYGKISERVPPNQLITTLFPSFFLLAGLHLLLPLPFYLSMVLRFPLPMHRLRCSFINFLIAPSLELLATQSHAARQICKSHNNEQHTVKDRRN